MWSSRLERNEDETQKCMWQVEHAIRQSLGAKKDVQFTSY